MIRVDNILSSFLKPPIPIGGPGNPLAAGWGLSLSVTGDDYFILDAKTRIRYRLPRKHLDSTVDFLTDVAKSNCQAMAGCLFISFVRFGDRTLSVTPEAAQGLLWGLEILKNGPVQKIPSCLIQKGCEKSAKVLS